MNDLAGRCCVFGCSKKVVQGVPLHRFPNPNKRPDLFAAWVSAVGEKLTETDPLRIYSNKRVCDYHFLPEKMTTGRRLIWTAVPTILDSVQQSLMTILVLEHNYCMARRANVSIPSTTISKAAVDNASNESSETKLPTVGDIETDYVWSPAEKSTENQNNESKVLAPFSWQMDHVPDLQDYNDPVYYDGNEHHPPIIDLDLDDDDDDIQDISTHQYKCNACKDVIKSDRFACAQCVDYDLCAQCAGERAAHRQHYLLRVPPRRPPAEVQLVLQKVRELLMSVIASAAVPLVNNTEETEIKMEVKDEEEATEDPLNVEETMATVPDMDDDNLEPHQEGDASTDTLNVEDNSDEIETTQLTLTNETHKRAYKNVRVRHSSPSKKKRRVIVVKNSTPVLKYVENTLPVTSSSSVPTDKEESSAAHSAQHRVSEIHRLPDSTIPLLQDIQQTGKPKQFLLQTVKRNDKVLLNLKNLRIVKVQTPDKT